MLRKPPYSCNWIPRWYLLQNIMVTNNKTALSTNGFFMSHFRLIGKNQFWCCLVFSVLNMGASYWFLANYLGIFASSIPLCLLLSSPHVSNEPSETPCYTVSPMTKKPFCECECACECASMSVHECVCARGDVFWANTYQDPLKSLALYSNVTLTEFIISYLLIN